MHRTLLHAGLALALGATPVLAADVDAAQAKTLESQIRDWLGGLLGAGMKLGDRPVSITAAGDHFDVSAPWALGSANSPLVFSGAARPMDGGRWSIDGVKVASPVTFTLDMPTPPRPGAPKPTGTTPVRYTVTATGQDGRIVWDPSFATPSTWTSATQKVTAHAEGGPMTQDSTFGPITSLGTLRPAGPGRVDVLTEGTMLDYKASIGGQNGTQTGGADKSEIGMQRVRVNAAMNGVSRAKAVSILQTLVSAYASPDRPLGAAPLPPATVRAVLDALQDVASEFSLDETLEGIAVRAQGMTVLLDRAKLGFGAKSDQGMLQADLDLGVDGLKIPDLPLGGLEALIPQRVALRPIVSGLSVADLLRMAHASSEGRDATPGDIAALFSHGGIDAGLESMTIELGGAVITGHGKVAMTSPQQYSGEGQIVAENFDGLMQKINGIPAAAQAGPVLLLAKGMGRAEGKTVVWDISYHDGKVLVNNVDMAAMMGGGGGPPTRSAPQRPPQDRPPQNRTR